MKVTFLSPQTLGNKRYPNGTQEVPNHVSCNVAFKALVKAGIAIIHGAAPSAVRTQELIELEHARKSQLAKELTEKMEREK
jgi:hypothetical protein